MRSTRPIRKGVRKGSIALYIEMVTQIRRAVLRKQLKQESAGARQSVRTDLCEDDNPERHVRQD